MRKIFYILFILLSFSNITFAQKECCPKFEILPTMFPCQEEREQDPVQDTVEDKEECEWYACKHTNQTYLISPAKRGYTFTWQVAGGTPTTLTGSMVQIKWGIGDKAKIKVFITNADGSCRDTIEKNICLQDAPIANFNFTPSSPVCLNQSINFNNSSIGATGYSWNFGDGTSSSLTNPSHTYTTPGTYTIVLAVTNHKEDKPYNGGTGNPDFPKEPELECGCRDTIRKTITVSDISGVTILPECKQMLCKGDTASYCTTNQCNAYNWTVTGGRILGSAKDKCVKVVWDGNYPATLTMSGNCGGACSNTGTIQVPVLYPTMPITGDVIVCPNSYHSYSLPTMPGTFYKWKITGPNNSISGADSNISVINVNWGNDTGRFTITCDYHNPHTGCSGKGSINVQILPPFKINGKIKYCVGNAFIYTANGAAKWTIEPTIGHTPSTFPDGTSINGIWNKPGIYNITATPTSPTNFCSYPDVLQVVVLDTPKLNTIVGSKLICPGSTELYSISSNMNNGLFFWTASGGTITAMMGSHHDSIMVKWNATGPYTLQVYQTVKGCSSSPKKITIDAYKPPTVSGPQTACMDAEAVYTATGTAPAGGYTWSLDNALGTIISAQGTNTIKILWHGALPPAPSTCNVIVTTCGGVATLPITITVPPNVIINKTGNFCGSSGITLTSSITGSSYNWKKDGIPVGTNTQSINIVAAGIYTVEVISSGGCKSKATIVIPEEKLNVTATISTMDKTVWGCTETINTNLHAAPASGGYCYQWFRSPVKAMPGSPISGATTPNYAATTIGFYWCVISICNTNCKAMTDTIEIIKNGCAPGCVIDFTFAITKSGCNPFSFTCNTSPAAAGNNIQWFFGDGHQAIGNSTTNQYRDTGSYKVCAYMGGCPYVFKDTCFTIKVKIAANFTASANCNKVAVINLCKAAAPVTYSWSIPGGSVTGSLSSPNPGIITYSTAGLHTISVTVNDGTCSVTYSDTVRTHNADAVMNIPTPICAETNAPFTATSSNTALNYQWNFGDGYISNLQNTTHAYSTTGLKTVILKVTDPISGCTNFDTTIITVLSKVTVSIGSDKYVCTGSTTTISATTGFSTYQWYKDGIAISGATNSTYSTGVFGEYWVIASNGDGCVATSNKIHVLYASSPIANIDDDVKQVCTSDPRFELKNTYVEFGVTYSWKGTGPGGYTYTGTGSPTGTGFPPSINLTTPGEYSFVLTATNAQGCSAYDTICVMVFKSPTISLTSPAGPLCEGAIHTFTALASPNISPDNYTYFWNTGLFGSSMSTGEPGMYSVGVTDPDGCGAMAITPKIEPRPNVSLFPVGCDTLCLTDTIFFPLPMPSMLGYNITWIDDDGITLNNVGSGFNLPLAGFSPGSHHFKAIVSFGGGCADTTGTYDLYVKDCTLLPPCNNCVGLYESPSLQTSTPLTSSGNYQIANSSITITILKPVKEVRISLADLKYYWKDSTCINCKLIPIERGCLFPASTGQTVGTLNVNNTAIVASSAATTDCPQELIWKGGSTLQPGTYTIPIQLSLPKPVKDKCALVLGKFCVHITLIDEDCKKCETNICNNDPHSNGDSCKCNLSGSWTSLYLIPTKPAIAKPKNQILCGNTIDGIASKTLYTLSGLYHCLTKCMSTKNEVVVKNYVGDIIYTHSGAALNETFQFPANGMYAITLTATCGTQKCVCSFRITVVDGCLDCPPIVKPPVIIPPISKPIDSILTKILPPDFNGGILISQNDSVLYEKYISYKDKVTSHTAFDLASITKTFTSMAILKLMENGKLNLDDAVSKYLPEFPVQEITIKMLLSHRSGLEDYLKFMDESDWDKTKNLTNSDLLQFIVKNKSKVLINTPGKTFDYSNTNFALLSLIIEKISGQSYKDYLSSTFFKPLQMNDTYVLGLENFATATKSYYKNGSSYKLRYLDLVYGDKNVYSTVQDLKKWDKALHAGKLFKQSTLDLAYAATSPLAPFVSNYGLGWKKLITNNGKEIIYHTGWWAGSRSIIIRLLKENTLIAVVSNNNFTNITDIKKLCDLFGDYQLGNKKITNF